MSDRWDRLVAAVGEAASMDREQARAYLDETFADDAALLEEAVAILDGGLEPDGFLTQGDERPEQIQGIGPGMSFGEFRVERLLGRGGMGAVFLARQEKPSRAVALKILETPLLSGRAKARFEYEVQALATLRHRGIAQVYETGVERLDDGVVPREVPWFAMEYVEGETTLLEYARRQALGAGERLRLLIEVCDAVHHGHQKGVVHRDLKPENILVNQAGHPKVIDYGVARDLDGAETTPGGTGMTEVIGTLPYMSPERVTTGRGGADVRTDVYALGVVLYQLLTGTLPIQVDTHDIVTSARRICEEPPTPPSSTDAALGKDLDAISLKALAKDPDERYASADALAMDLRRFLEHRPISARTPGAWYHFRLFARRHRALVAAGAAVFLIGGVATLLSINWALRSERAEELADKKRQEAVEERDRGERLFETVLKRSLETTLREAPRLHKMPGGAERVKAMMANVLKDLEVLESMSQGDPRVQVLVAETWLKIGDTQGNHVFANLGDRDAAEASYRHALEVSERIVAEHPTDRRARIALVRSRMRLAEILDQAERVLKVYQTRAPQLRAERRVLLEAGLAEGLALVVEDPADRAFLRDVEDLYVGLGQLAQDESRFDDMRSYAKALHALYEAEQLPSPLQALLIEAWSYRYEKNWEVAVPAWRRVVERSGVDMQREDSPYPRRFLHAQYLGTLSECAAKLGDNATAIASLEKAIGILEGCATQSPSDKRVRIQLHMQRVSLAYAYARHAKGEGAGERDLWLGRARARLIAALEAMGPEENDTSIRKSLRGKLTRDIERIDSARGE